MFLRLARLLSFCICGFVLYRSGRMALADMAVARCLKCAIRIEPSNESYVSRAAIARDQAGDLSGEVDTELRRALAMNPNDSAALMSLGLRASFKGRSFEGEAESDLFQATVVDHTFQPQWVLANFYVRTGQLTKFWPSVRKSLEIIEPRSPDPRTVNAEPVFDLCWNVTLDSSEILAQVLPSRRMLLPYLLYLIKTHHVEAAQEALPFALASRPTPSDVPAFLGICELMIRENRTATAVLVWNRLVDYGLIRATHLEPLQARSLSNSDFTLPLFERAFDWKLHHEDNAFAFAGDRFLAFEMAGPKAEHFELLSKVLPVIGGQPYLLKWRVDASRMNSPLRKNAGFAVHLFGPEGEISPTCPPFLSETTTCLFTTSTSTSQLRFSLRYDHPVGGIRPTGVMRILQFGLEFRP